MKKKITLYADSNSANSYLLAQCLKDQPGYTCIITETMVEAQRYQKEIAFFYPDVEAQLQPFPDWETLAYDTLSPHQDLVAERLSLLNQLPTKSTGALITSAQTLLQRLAPLTYVQQHSLILKRGDTLILDQYRQHLTKAGYCSVKQVSSQGEFAIRGSILDLFPTGSQQPYRIDLLDDEIDSIRPFDPETQRSQKTIEHIELLPAREYPLTDEARQCFADNWQQHFSDHGTALVEQVNKGQPFAGIEYYLPLFFTETASLFDYLPDNTTLIFVGDIAERCQQFWHDVQQRYQQYRHDIERPILAPQGLFLNIDDYFTQAKAFQQIHCRQTQSKQGAKASVATQTLPEVRSNPHQQQPLNALSTWISQTQARVCFCADSAGRREILSQQLQQLNIHVQTQTTWQMVFTGTERFNIITSPLEDGLWLQDQNLILITEKMLFGYTPKATKVTTDSDQTAIAIRDISEIQVGDAVVHLEHGVARYQGLTTLSIGGKTNEFITLSYAREDKLYVPITATHLISRYSSQDLEHAPVNQLGTDKWSKAKEKAAKRIHDTAAELLEIYAQRAAKTGHAYNEPDDDYARFAAQFAFEETPDQTQAIVEVLKDMMSAQPMDRLLCGDVGFGKTEVALRAAYLATQNGKQVAILVPTTLLAQQHYENFCDRFADWPIEIALLSRFKTAKEQNENLKKMANGQVDIVIGTHKLLSKSVQFHDLGLLIIDEEHRFGVRHKEKLKALRTHVDILAMTATPIPRTLNMALSSIRDLSIIATPPPKRLAVKTFIAGHDDANTIKEAILREIMRGGQVYFLHNNVNTIAHTAEQLQQWLPDIKMAIGHGQMRERELEQVMADFYHNRFQVLVCTTIIETGLDVPNANTIIIDRADHLGLAQLHQLRGRVGRSHHQAYAYLLTPPIKLLNKDAQKRIEAIESANTLGSGYTLASHDLEIRGAGELLGDEQSGQMQTIGFGLYMELLDRTVNALKSGKKTDNLQQLLLPANCEVDLQTSCIIPEDYLPDVAMRLQLYQRLNQCQKQADLDALQVEMIDRFGLLPDATKALFAATAIRLKAETLQIRKIDVRSETIHCHFYDNTSVEPKTIIGLVQKMPYRYQLKGPQSIIILTTAKTLEDKVKNIHEFLDTLSP